jgi:transposase-like protein
VFVSINGQTHYHWRAAYHEGEVLKVFVTAEGLRFLS